MITASIVTYKTNRNELEIVLKNATESPINKIFIIDNSPNDKLKEFATFSSKVEYLYGQGNIGYGAGHNIAIRKAIANNTKYHIIINPDIQFGHGTIEKLTDYMDAHPEVGQIMPRIIYPNGELQYLCKLLPTPMDLFGRRFLPFKNYVHKRNLKYEMHASGYDKLMEVPFLSGCFMFLRIQALKEIGLFSDRYWMYCEDIDLCRRISEKYKTIYFPFVTIIHAHRKESFKNKKLLWQHIKSACAYFNHYGWIFDSFRNRRNKQAQAQYQKYK